MSATCTASKAPIESLLIFGPNNQEANQFPPLDSTIPGGGGQLTSATPGNDAHFDPHKPASQRAQTALPVCACPRTTDGRGPPARAYRNMFASSRGGATKKGGGGSTRSPWCLTLAWAASATVSGHRRSCHHLIHNNLPVPPS
jgi:hypothetical protein